MKTKSKLNKKQESGQIIVILALSLVVVMMVAALAVDGGMVYSERRFAQNAADASAMAGGGALVYSGELDINFICPPESNYAESSGKFSHGSSVNIVEAAYIAARNVAQINNVSDLPFLGYVKNGEVIDSFGEGINSNHGVVVECTSNETTKFIDTNVKISSQISTAFAHLIFPGPMITTNKAVSRVEPFIKVLGGYALVSLSDTCKTWDKNYNDYLITEKGFVPGVIGGMRFDGMGSEGRVIVNKGMIHTNSCYHLNGGSTPERIEVDEDGFITSTKETAFLSPPADWLTPVEAAVEGFDFSVGTSLPLEYPGDMSCSEVGEIVPGGGPNGETLYKPGNFNGITIGGGNFYFDPGTYCVKGDFIAEGSGYMVGEEITFYIQKASPTLNATPSIVSIAGSKTVLLAAPVKEPSGTETTKNNFGYLFFMDDDNVKIQSGNITQRGLIRLVGNNSSYYAGTIYAHTGALDIGGTSQTGENVCVLVYDEQEDLDRCESTTFTSKFIGHFVQIRGSAILEILYDEDNDPLDGGNFYLLQ